MVLGGTGARVGRCRPPLCLWGSEARFQGTTGPPRRAADTAIEADQKRPAGESAAPSRFEACGRGSAGGAYVLSPPSQELSQRVGFRVQEQRFFQNRLAARAPVQAFAHPGVPLHATGLGGQPHRRGYVNSRNYNQIK